MVQLELYTDVRSAKIQMNKRLSGRFFLNRQASKTTHHTNTPITHPYEVVSGFALLMSQGINGI